MRRILSIIVIGLIAVGAVAQQTPDTRAPLGKIVRDVYNYTPVIAYYDSTSRTVFMVNSNHPLPVSLSAAITTGGSVATTGTSDSSVVDSTAKRISAADVNRMSETLVNTAATTVWIAFKDTAFKRSGYPLRQWASFTYGLGTPIPYTGAVWAVADTGVGMLITRLKVTK